MKVNRESPCVYKGETVLELQVGLAKLSSNKYVMISISSTENRTISNLIDSIVQKMKSIQHEMEGVQKELPFVWKCKESLAYILH